MKKIPYGMQNFETLRNDNCYYVDKTDFIQKIEDDAKCLMFLRPRRFGKTLLISTLENYYDINKANDFEKLFKDTYVYNNPTPLKNSYYILRLDFSNVDINAGIDIAIESFNTQILKNINTFYTYYKNVMGGDIAFKEDISTNIGATTSFSSFISNIKKRNIKIFLLIDEYDNFANNILTQYGKKVYQDITQKGGFIRSFFASVKAGNASGVIDRIFMTGVSPMLMSDMTSGFNIALNISRDEDYHNLVGFTQNELEEMISYYINEDIIKKEDKETIISTCKEYYDNYRFSKKDVSLVFNSNLVIWYLKNYAENGGLHDELIDQNILTDYGKLRNIVIHDKELNGNYSVLSELISTGKTASELVDVFPMEAITDTKSFKSLLFYLGLITIKDVDDFGGYVFSIPNKTIESVHFSYIRKALNDAFDVKFNISKIENALKNMARTGDALPAFQIIADTFYETASLRDFIEKESSFKAYLLSYFALVSFFNIFSEREFNKGYADVFIEPNPIICHIKSPSFLIELKFVHAKERTKKYIKELEKQAQMQLESYEKDAYFNGKDLKKYIFILSSKQIEVLKEV